MSALSVDASRPPMVLIVGALPPTIGGVSIHVERLAGVMHRAGYLVCVYDIYTRKASKHASYKVRQVRGLRFAVELFWAMWRYRPAVVHWHVSQGTHLWQLYCILWASPPGVSHLFTFHTGKLGEEMASLPGWKRWFCRQVLRDAAFVISVSPISARFLRLEFGISPARLTVIQPFIAPSVKFAQCSPPELGAPRVAIVSGYATPLYDWMTLVEGCQLARECLREVRLVFYNRPDPNYRAEVLALAERSPGLFKIYEEMSPDKFARVLASSDLFIRPTLTDGDSVALREALYRGIACIASDAVPRPEGCLLFRVGEAADLARALRVVCTTRVPNTSGANDGAAPLLELYRRIVHDPFPTSGG